MTFHPKIKQIFSDLGIQDSKKLNEKNTTEILNRVSKYIDIIEKDNQEKTAEVEKLNVVIDSIPCTISWIDENFNYLGVNDVLSRICKVDKDYFKDKKVGFLTEQDYFYNFAKKLFTSRDSFLEDELESDIDGEKFYFLTFGQRYNNDKEAVIIGIDISKQKFFEQKLFFADKMSTLGQMAAEIAHEVNNPLALIHSKTEQLSKMLVSNPEHQNKISDIAQKIEKMVKRITRLVSGLKNFSRNESHDPIVPVILKTIIDDALELCRKRLNNMGIKVVVKTFDTKLAIPCRASQMEQVLVNLINNACDAIEQLDEQWINIEIEENKDNIIIKVTDSGTGIPEDLRDKILQPFFSTKNVGKGTGLGLSISKGIVESHNGKLFISRKSPNTQFRIVLPNK